MKIKRLLTGIFCISLIGIGIEANANDMLSKKFIDNLVNCNLYTESQKLELFGGKITPTVEVKGWENEKCTYVNYMKEAPESKYICHFTQEQLDEIKETAKKDQSQKETYSSGGMSYSADPLSVLFTKYMNDAATCTTPD